MRFAPSFHAKTSTSTSEGSSSRACVRKHAQISPSRPLTLPHTSHTPHNRSPAIGAARTPGRGAPHPPDRRSARRDLCRRRRETRTRRQKSTRRRKTSCWRRAVPPAAERPSPQASFSKFGEVCNFPYLSRLATSYASGRASYMPGDQLAARAGNTSKLEHTSLRPTRGEVLRWGRERRGAGWEQPAGSAAETAWQ